MDAGQTREARNEFLASAGAFLKDAIPVMQVAPSFAPVMGEMLLFAVRGYRAGRTLESAFEEAVQDIKDQVEQAAQQPQQEEGPPPDPKAEAEAARTQQQMQIDGASAQIELQSQQQKAAIEAEKGAAELEKTVAEVQKQLLESEEARLDVETKNVNVLLSGFLSLGATGDSKADSGTRIHSKDDISPSVYSLNEIALHPRRQKAAPRGRG